MPEEICPVQWKGRQAVVTLPQHIDGSNADRIRERLLWIINRGAAVLIADLTGTVSCDYSGAEALARAQHRAVANGTELRVVVTADIVRRVLAVTGLDCLVGVYPDLDCVLAAGAERAEAGGQSGAAVIADQVAYAGELLDSVVHNIFIVGLMLQAAADLPHDAAALRITETLGRLDDVVREVRDHVLADRSQSIRPGSAWRPPPDVLERSALAMDRAAALRQRVAQTAHALHFTAADTAALLERRADLLGQPTRIDYPTEAKRWRVLADQAGQMAELWEQRPLPAGRITIRRQSTGGARARTLRGAISWQSWLPGWSISSRSGVIRWDDCPRRCPARSPWPITCAAPLCPLMTAARPLTCW